MRSAPLRKEKMVEPNVHPSRPASGLGGLSRPGEVAGGEAQLETLELELAPGWGREGPVIFPPPRRGEVLGAAHLPPPERPSGRKTAATKPLTSPCNILTSSCKAAASPHRLFIALLSGGESFLQCFLQYFSALPSQHPLLVVT